jgi:hypothetical protein
MSTLLGRLIESKPLGAREAEMMLGTLCIPLLEWGIVLA